MSNKADVVIVGGGVIGCATAYYLSKKGTSVIVLEGSENIQSKHILEAASFRPTLEYFKWG